MKRCSKCLTEKPATEFYSDRRRSDGLRASCKACHYKTVRAYRENNQEAYSAQLKAYREHIPPETAQVWRRAYLERYPERRAERRRKFRSENPEKDRAHQTVRNAVRSGVLRASSVCVRCNASGRIEASHVDYSKPLEVEWLCVTCHRRKDRAALAAVSTGNGTGETNG